MRPLRVLLERPQDEKASKVRRLLILSAYTRWRDSSSSWALGRLQVSAFSAELDDGQKRSLVTVWIKSQVQMERIGHALQRNSSSSRLFFFFCFFFSKNVLTLLTCRAYISCTFLITWHFVRFLFRVGHFQYLLPSARTERVLSFQVPTDLGLVSHQVQLEVLVPDVFILGPKDLIVDRGTTLSLVCIVENVSQKTH